MCVHRNFMSSSGLMCKMWSEAGKWAANKMWNWKIKINWWNFSTKISSFSFISSRHSDETRSNTVCLHTAVEFFPIDFSLSGASSDGRGRDHRRLQHKSPYTASVVGMNMEKRLRCSPSSKETQPMHSVPFNSCLTTGSRWRSEPFARHISAH